MNIIKSRLILTILLPSGMILLAIGTFFVILIGRKEQRKEIARGMSRTLSALWDGDGDCTFSAWSYRMLDHGKKWGPPRVKFVDWLNAESGHCRKAWEWHNEHKLFDRDDMK